MNEPGNTVPRPWRAQPGTLDALRAERDMLLRGTSLLTPEQSAAERGGYIYTPNRLHAAEARVSVLESQLAGIPWAEIQDLLLHIHGPDADRPDRIVARWLATAMPCSVLRRPQFEAPVTAFERLQGWLDADPSHQVRIYASHGNAAVSVTGTELRERPTIAAAIEAALDLEQEAARE